MIDLLHAIRMWFYMQRPEVLLFIGFNAGAVFVCAIHWWKQDPVERAVRDEK